MNMAVTNLHGGAEQIKGNADEALTAASKKKRRRTFQALARSTVIVAAIGMAVVVPMGWGHWVAGMTDQSTDDAYLKADTASVGTEVSGRVRKVLVADFQHVKAGELLAQIDDRDYRAQLGRAYATRKAAAASVAILESQINLQASVIAQAEASVKAVKADMERAESEYLRQQEASRIGWSTAQKREAATAEMKRYSAQVEERQTAVDVEKQKVAVLSAQLSEAQATLDAQRAAVELARITLERTSIRAPFDGVASASNVRQGQYVNVGTKIISVVPLPHLYVIANFKETQLGKVSVGQRVTMTVDMLPGKLLRGHVAKISPASGSEFALLTPDNATGNFTKVTQRVPVRIELVDTGEVGKFLRPGMSVVPTIHSDEFAGREQE
ncbi:HlyD family secretion protein [Ochrobactrum teleogrylli]|uniref:HlyD family secretion protein n=1 Tax=Ochrobactrum teleogrylli TaxID=2479765 RepID=UPI00384C17D5